MTTYITLPFRDRLGKYQKALDSFIEPFTSYLKSNLNDYVLYIVEQNNTHDLFNLGRTINIGFDLYKDKMKDDDIFIFHPVDILPIDTNYKFIKTTKICSIRHSPSGEFYKGLAFLVKDYKNLNGFSNNYWGWGLEDNDMFKRFQINNIIPDVILNTYVELVDDGNSNPGEPLYAPLYGDNHKYLKECYTVSGLNNLKYQLIQKTNYRGIEKFIIE